MVTIFSEVGRTARYQPSICLMGLRKMSGNSVSQLRVTMGGCQIQVRIIIAWANVLSKHNQTSRRHTLLPSMDCITYVIIIHHTLRHIHKHMIPRVKIIDFLPVMCLA